MPAHQHPPKNWRSLPSLTLTEAASVLGWSRSQTYAVAQAGRLATHLDHLGRHRVLPADLEPLLAAQVADQADLFALDEPRRREQPTPAAPPEPSEAAQVPPPKMPERTPPTAAFRAAKAALKRSRRGAP